VVNKGNRLSPRAAVFISNEQKTGLKLLYAEGFRNPSMFEGFFEDKRDFAANKKIAPEVIRAGEVVAWFKVAGLSARASAFLWDARGVIEQRPIANPFDPTGGDVLQFQNAARYVTRGAEAEASYRDATGWYGFGGLTLAQVGTDVADPMTGDTTLRFGDVFDAPAVTAVGGVSTPKLLGYAHLGLEGQLLSSRASRPDSDGNTSPKAPPWFGLNATIYVPNIRGFDITAGGRNLLGKRDKVPAPDDYDRFPDPATTITVSRIPGEGREVYVKVGYSY